MSATQQDGQDEQASALGALAQHVNWDSVPVERPSEGIERQMVVGQNLMLCRFRFAPNLVTPEHSHPHEQMSIVVSGRVRFFIEGEERIAAPGDVLQFPPDCWHGATMMEEEVILLDIFTPVREDFLGR
ncbi:MAG TPA: cupin domain-containing protein [Pyrinomonadaceae bacterium]|nr:cupin domain-containing protein [Pyrinomonadaceae bacterium]